MIRSRVLEEQLGILALSYARSRGRPRAEIGQKMELIKHELSVRRRRRNHYVITQRDSTGSLLFLRRVSRGKQGAVWVPDFLRAKTYRDIKVAHVHATQHAVWCGSANRVQTVKEVCRG